MADGICPRCGFDQSRTFDPRASMSGAEFALLKRAAWIEQEDTIKALHEALNDLLGSVWQERKDWPLTTKALRALALRPDAWLTGSFAEEVRAIAQSHSLTPSEETRKND